MPVFFSSRRNKAILGVGCWQAIIIVIIVITVIIVIIGIIVIVIVITMISNTILLHQVKLLLSRYPSTLYR